MMNKSSLFDTLFPSSFSHPSFLYQTSQRRILRLSLLALNTDGGLQLWVVGWKSKALYEPTGRSLRFTPVYCTQCVCCKLHPPRQAGGDGRWSGVRRQARGGGVLRLSEAVLWPAAVRTWGLGGRPRQGSGNRHGLSPLSCLRCKPYSLKKSGCLL